MKIVLAGASGLIGSALSGLLVERGHVVLPLVREENEKKDLSLIWNPRHYKLDPKQLEGCDAIINLAGENISKRWSPQVKKEIQESRIKSTKTIVNAIGEMSHPPKVLINASAIGYYGVHESEVAAENTPPSDDFLGHVCQEWEAAAKGVEKYGVRLVIPRIGIVLSTKGGALGKMLPLFKVGLGGVIGTGKQIMSWIALPDLLEIFYTALTHPHLSGPLNAVSPQFVSNREFTKILGKILKRPTFFSVPSFALKGLLGEMAEAILLKGRAVEPRRLQEMRFAFSYPHLEQALTFLIEHQL